MQGHQGPGRGRPRAGWGWEEAGLQQLVPEKLWVELAVCTHTVPSPTPVTWPLHAQSLPEPSSLGRVEQPGRHQVTDSVGP